MSHEPGVPTIQSACDYCGIWEAGDSEDDEPRWYTCPICLSSE